MAQENNNPLFRVILSVAGLVIIIAGIRAAEKVLVPFLLAVFIAVICSGPMLWLRRRGVPAILAIFLVLGGMMSLFILGVVLVQSSVDDFSANLPAYQDRLRHWTRDLTVHAERLGMDISSEALQDIFTPADAMQFTGVMLAQLRKLLTNTFLIVLTTVFIMLEFSGFPGRLGAALGRPEASLHGFNQFTETIKRYIALKTLISAGTGTVIGIGTALIGLDYPILWGMLAFLFNFVPNIGSILAGIPAVLLALIQLGTGGALGVTLIYLCTNIGFGNFIEPRFMGKGLGLSTLVVWLSLIFWGWTLGPPGMLLSVPLTMTVKIALESHPGTQDIAILLGRDKGEQKEKNEDLKETEDPSAEDQSDTK